MAAKRIVYALGAMVILPFSALSAYFGLPAICLIEQTDGASNSPKHKNIRSDRRSVLRKSMAKKKNPSRIKPST